MWRAPTSRGDDHSDLKHPQPLAMASSSQVYMCPSLPNERQRGWMGKHKGGPWPQSSFSLLYIQPLLQNSFCPCLPLLAFPLRALQTPGKTAAKDLANTVLSDPKFHIYQMVPPSSIKGHCITAIASCYCCWPLH